MRRSEALSSLKDSQESFASQESTGSFGMSGLYFSQESKTDPFDITGNLCNVCCLKPKNGLFCHEKSSHNYSCYPCSKKIWRKSGKCPICNITVKYVTKVYYCWYLCFSNFILTMCYVVYACSMHAHCILSN